MGSPMLERSIHEPTGSTIKSYLCSLLKHVSQESVFKQIMGHRLVYSLNPPTPAKKSQREKPKVIKIS